MRTRVKKWVWRPRVTFARRIQWKWLRTRDCRWSPWDRAPVNACKALAVVYYTTFFCLRWCLVHGSQNPHSNCQYIYSSLGEYWWCLFLRMPLKQHASPLRVQSRFLTRAPTHQMLLTWWMINLFLAQLAIHLGYFRNFPWLAIPPTMFTLLYSFVHTNFVICEVFFVHPCVKAWFDTLATAITSIRYRIFWPTQCWQSDKKCATLSMESISTQVDSNLVLQRQKNYKSLAEGWK